MSLLDLQKEIEKSGFDARKDSVNGPAEIPSGNYIVSLDDAKLKVFDSGWEALNLAFTVIDQSDFYGRKEFVSFGTLPEWKGKNMKFNQEKMIKFVMKLLEFSNVNLPSESWEDGVELAKAIKNSEALGTYYELEKNQKKTNGNTYNNYDLFEYDGGQPNDSTVSIDDEDLPF